MAVTYSFKGQVVLITGTSSGIGAETAVHFAEAGCDGLALVGRNKERLKEVGERCGIKGIDKSRILLIKEDMALDGGPERIMKAVEEKFGKLHTLVNNAGIFGPSSLSEPALMENDDKIYALDLRSTVLLTQLAVPHLLKTKGNIVNVSSICGKAADQSLQNEWAVGLQGCNHKPRYAYVVQRHPGVEVPNTLVYNIMKAALDYMTESSARYLAPKQVRVNSVNPGTIMTPLQTLAGRNIDEVKEQDNKIHPLGRIGESDEVAKTILFLASDHASFITGETISVDGGRFLLFP